MKGVVLRVYYQTGSTLYSLDAYTEIDETSSVVTGYRRSFAPGFYTVTIHYVKQTVTTTIQVISKDVVAVAVASKPAKDVYFVGDELETAGLTFAYTYNNGDTAVVTYDEAVAAGDALSVDYDFSVPLAESRVQTTFRFETSEGNPIVATFAVWVRMPSVLRVDLIRNPVSFGVTQNVNLLNDPDYVLWTLSFITVWQMAGYFMVLFLTGLVQIPTELYDAAKVDGARSPASLFANITWPLLGPTSFFIVILTIIKTFQVFDIVKVLTRGGPERASEILLYTMYQEGFSFFRMGTAAAIAALYLAVMLFLTWLQTHFIGRRVHYGFQ